MFIGVCRSLLVILLIFTPGFAMAKIADGIVCNKCHTMHNSQNAASLTITTTYGLLNNSCIGCHTGVDGTSPLSSFQAPVVMHTSSAPGDTSGSNNILAGGSFYWVSDAGGALDNRGHNIIGFNSEDATLGITPPGGSALTSQLTCAGTRGCHGDPSQINEVKSLMAHHKDDTPPLDGSTIATSYRFLSGVIGTEEATNSDWEWTYSSTDHNQYKGGSTWDSIDSTTLTALCVRCHGAFHGDPDVGSGSSPWIRHPTGVDLSDYGGEYINYTTYDARVPVASDTGLTVVSSDVQASGNGIVSCISCHRAHGSPYDSMMRWDNRSFPGTVEPIYGCGVCHSSKN